MTTEYTLADMGQSSHGTGRFNDVQMLRRIISIGTCWRKAVHDDDGNGIIDRYRSTLKIMQCPLQMVWFVIVRCLSLRTCT